MKISQINNIYNFNFRGIDYYSKKSPTAQTATVHYNNTETSQKISDFILKITTSAKEKQKELMEKFNEGDKTSTDGTILRKITKVKEKFTSEEEISFMDEFSKDGKLTSTTVFIGNKPRRFVQNPEFETEKPWCCTKEIIFNNYDIESYSENIRYYSNKAPNYSVEIAYQDGKPTRAEIPDPHGFIKKYEFKDNLWQETKY